jgi:catechol 2,3-dioxygenase-like lactoylglutathione lyase family enzyme
VNTPDRGDNRFTARQAAAGSLRASPTANRIIRRSGANALVFPPLTKTRSGGSPPMPLNALHHITVQTDDLEATRDFYRDVLGLRVGFRPDLDFAGYWLYCGEVPVVHLVPRGNAIGGGPSSDTGPFDHFAFLASDFQGVKSTLDKKGVSYRENHIASPPIDQLFFPDNNNVMVELNFPRA